MTQRSSGSTPSVRDVESATARTAVAAILFLGGAWLAAAANAGSPFLMMALAEVPLVGVLAVALRSTRRRAGLERSRVQRLLHLAITAAMLFLVVWTAAQGNARMAVATALGAVAAALVAWRPSLAPTPRRRNAAPRPDSALLLIRAR